MTKLPAGLLSTLTSSVYGDYTLYHQSSSQVTPTTPLFYASSKLAALTAYRDSYNWYIQRFYHLNTLPSLHSYTSNNLLVNTEMRNFTNKFTELSLQFDIDLKSAVSSSKRLLSPNTGANSSIAQHQ
jgi:hypothetical protein